VPLHPDLSELRTQAANPLRFAPGQRPKAAPSQKSSCTFGHSNAALRGCILSSDRSNGTHRVALTTAVATTRLSAPRCSVPPFRRDAAPPIQTREGRHEGWGLCPRCGLCVIRARRPRAHGSGSPLTGLRARRPLCAVRNWAWAHLLGVGEWITPSRVSPAPPRRGQRSRAMMMIQPPTLSPAHLYPAVARLDKLAALTTLSLLDIPPAPAARRDRRLPPGVEGGLNGIAAHRARRRSSRPPPLIAPAAAHRARRRSSRPPPRHVRRGRCSPLRSLSPPRRLARLPGAGQRPPPHHRPLALTLMTTDNGPQAGGWAGTAIAGKKRGWAWPSSWR